MASDLDEIRDRITWCGNRSLVLSAQIDQFISSGAYQISHEVDPGTGDGTYFLQLRKAVPTDFRIEAGAIVHELRASLDNLACVLAIRNGGSAKNTYFPVSRSLAIFENDGLKRKLRYLSEADRKVIAALKPYDGGNPLLFALHNCDLTRKHQRLIATAGGIHQFGIGNAAITTLEMLQTGPITTKRQPFARLGKGTHVDITIGIDISFSEPDAIKGRPVSTVLRDFTSLVHSIVDLFD